MNQEEITLIGAIAVVMLVFFVLPFIAVVKFSKKRMKIYEEAAARRSKHSRETRSANSLKADYAWRRWKVVYVIAAFLVLVGVFIGTSAYNSQRVCESWSSGDINGTTVFDRYRSGTTCKTLGERSEGVSMAVIMGISIIVLVAGWATLPALYRYIRPDKID